jgi:hypothetical protein
VDHGWLLFAGTFLIALFWNLRNSGARTEAVRRGAVRVRGQLAALYGGAHDIREIRLERATTLDLGFYERGREQLEALGYRFLHDIENVTVREATGMPACIRAHVGDHGATRAGLMHLRVGGWQRLVAALLRLDRDVRAVEFITEFEDGGYLITNNTKGIAEVPLPPAWEFEKLPVETSIGALANRHFARVRRRGGVPIRIRNVHDAFESYARQWMQASDWWHGRGGKMTREEWHSVTGAESRTSNELYDEVTRD